MSSCRVFNKTSCYLPRARWYERVPERLQPLVAFIGAMVAMFGAILLIASLGVVLYSPQLFKLFIPTLILALITIVLMGVAELICKSGPARIEADGERLTLVGGAQPRTVIPRDELVGVVTVRGFRKPLGAILVCKRRHVRLCGEWERNTQSAMHTIARWADAEHAVVRGMEGWKIALGLASAMSPMRNYYCRKCGYFVGTLGDEGRCPECGTQFSL